MHIDNSTTDTEALTLNAYPRALCYRKTRFGLVNVWWLLIFGASLFLYVYGVLWALIAGIAAILFVAGLVASRWEESHFQIMQQYSKQRDAYEPGYFANQYRFRRPEGMGRDFPG